MKDYFGAICTECEAIPPAVKAFDQATAAVHNALETFDKAVTKIPQLDSDKRKAFAEALAELCETDQAYNEDRAELLKKLAAFKKGPCKAMPGTNDKQHAARHAFEPISERIKGLVKHADLVYKLAQRTSDAAGELATDERAAEHLDRRSLSKLSKELDAKRKDAVEQLKVGSYFHKQIVWLQDRFPDAELRLVPGLVTVVDQKQIEAADWSLTPGRYVGVAPPETDEDFDFEQALRDIHVELTSLTAEAAELAVRIRDNFEELGI